MNKQFLNFASAAATALALAPTVIAGAVPKRALAATSTVKTIGSAKVTTTTGTKYVASPVSVYASNGSRVLRTLLKGTKLTIQGTALINGKAYYYLGKSPSSGVDEFVLNNNLSDSPVQPAVAATGVVKITATAGAQAVSKTGTSGKQLSTGSSWKIFGTTTISGSEYYNLGGDQYVLVSAGTLVSGTANGSGDPSRTANGSGAAAASSTPSTSSTTSSASSSTTSTSNTVSSIPAAPLVITPATGSIQINAAAATTVYDRSGNVTAKILNPATNWKYFGTAVINGTPYYSVGGNQFVRQSAASVVGPTTMSGQVSVNATGATLLKSDGVTPITNRSNVVRVLTPGSQWKVFAQLQLGNQTLYDLGGGQYVDASEVAYMSPAEVAANANTTVKSGIATIHYVPGYGIQVWHADNTLVYNADGSPKKLLDGTKWTVCNQRIVAGHTYYGLGGDQWIDSSYAALHDFN